MTTLPLPTSYPSLMQCMVWQEIIPVEPDGSRLKSRSDETMFLSSVHVVSMVRSWLKFHSGKARCIHYGVIIYNIVTRPPRLEHWKTSETSMEAWSNGHYFTKWFLLLRIPCDQNSFSDKSQPCYWYLIFS